MTFPNFYVVGAGRSGTTSLNDWLGRHPDIYLPARKSPNYFASSIDQPVWETPVARQMARDWVHDEQSYRKLFEDATIETAIGDVSPVYLQARPIAGAIHDASPNARIIAVLRDPVARACSHFLGRQRDGIEPPSVTLEGRLEEQAAVPLPEDVAFGHYIGCGQYHRFLSPYIERFGRDRVHIVLFDDLIANTPDVLAEMFRFLDVDPGFLPPLDVQLNRTGRIRNPVRRMIWTRSVRVRTAMRPHIPARFRSIAGRGFLSDLESIAIDPTLRRRLANLLRDDIDAMEDTLRRDLSAWKTA